MVQCSFHFTDSETDSRGLPEREDSLPSSQVVPRLELEPALGSGDFNDAPTFPLNVGMNLELHSREERMDKLWQTPPAVPR